MKLDSEIKLKKANEIIEMIGIGERGRFQMFFSSDAGNRMRKYMGYKSGAMSSKLMDIQPTYIDVKAPYSYYQYKGVVYVDPVTKAAGFLTQDGWKSRKGVSKVPSNRRLNYDKSKNALAGPDWDKRMVEAEGDALVRDLQKEFDRARRKK